jgi:hypothetical protein
VTQEQSHDQAVAEQELRDRVHDQRELEALLGAEYHRNSTGPRPPVPKDPRFWCNVHKRPTTYKESMWDGEGPCCSWCRDPNLLAPKSKQTFDEAAGDRKTGKTPSKAKPVKLKPSRYTSWD